MFFYLKLLDQEQVSIEINKIRSNQKELMNKHRDLEHAGPLVGFNLKPLDPKEIQAFKSNLPSF